MRLIISNVLLRGANRKSHWQNSGALTMFLKQSQHSVPPYLQLAVRALILNDVFTLSLKLTIA